jgi:hypothetical protein
LSATTGSIIRVDTSAGRWEAVPKALIEDSRLSAEARWFAIWLCARPVGWEIRTSGLTRLLKDQSRPSGQLGRDLVRRMLRELEDAGYLVRTRMRDADGRWVWSHSLNATPQVASTIDGLAGDGPAVAGATVDGEGVDLLQTELIQTKTYLKRTTTTTDPPNSNPSAQNVGVVSIDSLQFPEVLTGDAQRLAISLIGQCPNELRQAVLDQIAVYQQQGNVRSPLGLLYRLVQRAKIGEFIAAGMTVRRRREQLKERESIAQKIDAVSVGPRPASEIVKDKIVALRQKWPKEASDEKW